MLGKEHRVLIVDDDEDILTATRLLLKRRVGELLTCADPGHVTAVLRQHTVDVVLLDMNFAPGASNGEQGLALLKQIRKSDPDVVVVAITAHGGVDMAVEAMKHGATDFVAKPWQNEKLLATLSAAVALHASRSEARRLKQSNKLLSSRDSQPLIGQGKAMSKVMALLGRAAPTDANVLILGENGTGKELLAREIHRQSLRADAVFMSVDLGAVSETLFESELFGHRKGAFTGAHEDRVGRLEAANGGTLFLDEIANIPLSLQAKLLTVLEQRQVTPLGRNKSLALDVRVIAATNLPLPQLRDEKLFRQDLLFRLNTVELLLPPLRERADDVPALCDYYSRYFARKYNKPPRALSDTALQAASHYDWPGNIRALRHAIERAVIMADGEYLEATDLQIAVPQTATADIITEDAGGEASSSVDLNLARMEEKLIQTALTRHHYNISHAADELGLTRAALYRRMKKYGL